MHEGTAGEANGHESADAFLEQAIVRTQIHTKIETGLSLSQHSLHLQIGHHPAGNCYRLVPDTSLSNTLSQHMHLVHALLQLVAANGLGLDDVPSEVAIGQGLRALCLLGHFRDAGILDTTF